MSKTKKIICSSVKSGQRLPSHCASIDRNITQYEYLFGDYNRDGVKNIDSPHPLKKGGSRYPDIKKHPEYYHQARLGGTEAKLSDELLFIMRHNDRRSPFLKSYLRKNPGTYGRIKTVASTIQKLRYNHLGNISDISGVSHSVEKRKDVFNKVSDLKGKYRTRKSEEDNFYEKPLGGVYYAYHLGILGPHGDMLEVQVKTKKMQSLQDRMHGAYKSKGSLKGFEKLAKDLYNLGY